MGDDGREQDASSAWRSRGRSGDPVGFDKSRVHWFYDFDSADKSAALGQTLLQDQDYNTLLNKAKGLWLDGSLEDTFVNLVN